MFALTHTHTHMSVFPYRRIMYIHCKDRPDKAVCTNGLLVINMHWGPECRNLWRHTKWWKKHKRATRFN